MQYFLISRKGGCGDNRTELVTLKPTSKDSLSFQLAYESLLPTIYLLISFFPFNISDSLSLLMLPSLILKEPGPQVGTLPRGLAFVPLLGFQLSFMSRSFRLGFEHVTPS